MKTLNLILMTILSISFASHGQMPVAETSNLTKIMQKIKMDENDKFTINEALITRNEANIILSDAQKMMDDWVELKDITDRIGNFNDLKKKAERKTIKTECKILLAQSEALESYELFNDIINAFYVAQYKNLFPDVSNEIIAKANTLMKEAGLLWQSAKQTRDKGYEKGICRRSIEELIKAQKMEEDVIALQEQAFSLLLNFNLSEPYRINYAMLDLPKNVIPANTSVPVLLTENTTTSVSQNPYINNSEKTSVITFDDSCGDNNSKMITYRIQIGAFLGKANEATFRGITPISTEKNDKGFTRYLAGEYRNFEVAQHALNILQKTGFADAFIVMYTDNLRLGPGIASTGNAYAKKQ